MTQIYDEELFQEYKKKAITEVEKLVPGNKYFVDFYGEVTLLEILTNKESYALEGLEYKYEKTETSLIGLKFLLWDIFILAKNIL